MVTTLVGECVRKIDYCGGKFPLNKTLIRGDFKIFVPFVECTYAIEKDGKIYFNPYQLSYDEIGEAIKANRVIILKREFGEDGIVKYTNEQYECGFILNNTLQVCEQRLNLRKNDELAHDENVLVCERIDKIKKEVDRVKNILVYLGEEDIFNNINIKEKHFWLKDELPSKFENNKEQKGIYSLKYYIGKQIEFFYNYLIRRKIIDPLKKYDVECENEYCIKYNVTKMIEEIWHYINILNKSIQQIEEQNDIVFHDEICMNDIIEDYLIVEDNTLNESKIFSIKIYVKEIFDDGFCRKNSVNNIVHSNSYCLAKSSPKNGNMWNIFPAANGKISKSEIIDIDEIKKQFDKKKKEQLLYENYEAVK